MSNPKSDLIDNSLIDKFFTLVDLHTKDQCILAKKLSLIPNFGHFLNNPTMDLLKIIVADALNYLHYREYYDKQIQPDNLVLAKEKALPLIQELDEIKKTSQSSVYELDKIDFPVDLPSLNPTSVPEYLDKPIEELVKDAPINKVEEKSDKNLIVTTIGSLKDGLNSLLDEAVSGVEDITAIAQETLKESVNEFVEENTYEEPAIVENNIQEQPSVTIPDPNIEMNNFSNRVKALFGRAYLFKLNQDAYAPYSYAELNRIPQEDFVTIIAKINDDLNKDIPNKQDPDTPIKPKWFSKDEHEKNKRSGKLIHPSIDLVTEPDNLFESTEFDKLKISKKKIV